MRRACCVARSSGQVEGALAGVDVEVIAHTDVFDQPYFTRNLAHAALIGRLGNRLLGCAYFGLTTVPCRAADAPRPPLPGTSPPLNDAVEELFDDEVHLRWWPCLTIVHRGAGLWRSHAPTLCNATRALPIAVRHDRRGGGGDAADGPWKVVVPALPDDANAVRGIRFRSAAACTGAACTGADLSSLDELKAL